MIRSYRTEGGKIIPAEGISRGTWVRMTIPDPDEISKVAETLGFDITDVNASLDKDEGSRVEYDNGTMVAIIDIPYRNTTPESSPYNTIPLAVISSEDNILTVSQMDSGIVDRFTTSVGVDISDKTAFILKLMYTVSIEYQQFLREINGQRREIEKRLDRSTKNSDIIELHRLESSLVYFSTSLRACNVVLDKMRRYGETKMDKQHFDLLHDVTVENEQAIEMATIYREIIDGTRELFVSVANNRLNDVMKWLTAVTIILSIPMILGGLYGMNVDLPMASSPYAFWMLIAGTILICAGLAFWLRKRQML